MTRKDQIGSAHVVLLSALVVAIIGALGFVFWQNFAKEESRSETATQKHHNSAKSLTTEVVEGSRPDLHKYVNHKIGFEFEFPKKAYEPTNCGVVTSVHDNYGNTVVIDPYYTVTERGLTDIQVVNHGNFYTVVQKNAPIFSQQSTLPDGRMVYKACTVERVESSNIEIALESAIENRSWYVTKIVSEEQVNNEFTKAIGGKSGSIATKLGDAEGNRRPVTYSRTDGLVAGGYAYVAWYYPETKIFTYFAKGQSQAFAKTSDQTSWYLDSIEKSFKFI